MLPLSLASLGSVGFVLVSYRFDSFWLCVVLLGLFTVWLALVRY